MHEAVDVVLCDGLGNTRSALYMNIFQVEVPDFVSLCIAPHFVCKENELRGVVPSD